MNEYSAFISYSHSDRRLAKWLQSSLETYRIPRAIREKYGRPGHLEPVFLDESDMGASQNLGDAVERALDASRMLIVICSPASRRSQWVQAEVEYFIALGRRDRVVLVLAEGTPEEAFPHQFLERAAQSQEGQPGALANLPLAADARPDEGSMRALRARVRLWVMAALLSIPLDELVRRHHLRQVRMLFAASSASLLVAVAMVGLALLAIYQRDRAEAQERRAQLQLVDSRLQQGGALLAARRWAEGYAAFEEAQILIDELGISRIPLGLKLVEAEQRSIAPFRYLALPGVRELEISNDGQRMAVLAERQAHVFDLTVDRRIRSVPISALDSLLALSEDGSMLAVATGDELRLFSAERDEEFEVPWRAAADIVHVDFAVGSPRIFMAEGDGRVIAWTLGQSAPITLIQREAAVADMRTSADDTRLVVSWADGTTQTCRILDNACVDQVSIDAGAVSSVALAPDGTWLATADGEFLRFWDGYTGEFLSESPMESDFVEFVGANVMVSARDGGVTVFDPGTGLQLGQFDSPPTLLENRVAFSLERLALFSTYDGGVLYWQLSFGVPGNGSNLAWPGELEEWLEALCIWDDGSLIAGGTASGQIRVWDAYDSRLVKTIETRGGSVLGLAVVGDGRRIISIADSGETTVWDLLTGEPIERFVAAPDEPTAIARNADASRIAIGSGLGAVAILDIATGERIGPVFEVAGAVSSLGFAADDSWLAIGTEGGRFYVWSARRQRAREVTRLDGAGEEGLLRVEARGSDQAFIVLGSAELWDLRSGKRLETYGSRLTENWHAGLLGDSLVYTGGVDQFSVFDADTNAEIATLQLGAGLILSGGTATADGMVFAAQNFWGADIFRWQEALNRSDLRRQLAATDLMSGVDVPARVELLARWYLAHGFASRAADYLERPEYRPHSMSPLAAGRILRADGQIDRARVEFARAVSAGEVGPAYVELVLQ